MNPYRRNKILCLVCGYEAMKSIATKNLTRCPDCKTKMPPADGDKVEHIYISVEELRALFNWAEVTAYQSNSEKFPSILVFQNILERVENQRKFKDPITLSQHMEWLYNLEDPPQET